LDIFSAFTTDNVFFRFLGKSIFPADIALYWLERWGSNHIFGNVVKGVDTESEP
jgi:hypothetical protein